MKTTKIHWDTLLSGWLALYFDSETTESSLVTLGSDPTMRDETLEQLAKLRAPEFMAIPENPTTINRKDI